MLNRVKERLAILRRLRVEDVEYSFLGRECKSTGIGKTEAEVFMSQEEIFIPRSDSWLSSRGLADDV